jgi:hypothetical protein
MTPELIEVVRKLKSLDNEAEEYISPIPYDIANAIFDNTYVNAKGLMLDTVVDALFGVNTEEVVWFLYEWKPGNKEPQIFLADGTKIVLETEEQYYKYLESV